MYIYIQIMYIYVCIHIYIYVYTYLHVFVYHMISPYISINSKEIKKIWRERHITKALKDGGGRRRCRSHVQAIGCTS